MTHRAGPRQVGENVRAEIVRAHQFECVVGARVFGPAGVERRGNLFEHDPVGQPGGPAFYEWLETKAMRATVPEHFGDNDLVRQRCFNGGGYNLVVDTFREARLRRRIARYQHQYRQTF